jgi:Bacterial lipoate protein ligase C-terminus.
LRISDFYGDFFGNAELKELEDSLYMVNLDDNLKDYLSRIDIGKYINGLSADDLYDLLRY